MPKRIYGAYGLTGGAVGDLDSIDATDTKGDGSGVALADKDMALVMVPLSDMFPYTYDDDSGAAESSPDVIQPDANAGNGRWILQGLTAASLTLTGNITMPDGGTIGQAAGPLLAFDDTSNYLEITGCNVGIGTTTPNALLHVSGGAILLDNNKAYQLKDTGGVARYVMFAGGDNSLNIGDYGGGFICLRLFAGGNEGIRLTNDGNVGIGTTSPDTALHISKNVPTFTLTDADSESLRSSARIIFQDSDETQLGFVGMRSNSDDIEVSASNSLGKLYLGAGGDSDNILIDRNGNVGIGTTSPATSAKLDISSTTGALLLTRMTTAQRDALTAVNGMILYNTTLNKVQVYEGGAWASVI